MIIREDDVTSSDVIALITTHLREAAVASPPECVYALDVEALRAPAITFWCVRDEDGELLGCGALKTLDLDHGEIKSMHTAASARRRGVARSMVAHIIAEARERGYRRLSLETGSMAEFAPARALYRSFGFVLCGAFADYPSDPSSSFMTLALV